MTERETDLPTKEGIKLWLRRTGKTRRWLAERCGVDASTVNGWLAPSKPISQKVLLSIRALMMGDASCEIIIPPIDMTIRLTPDAFARYSRAAEESGLSLSEWIARALDDVSQ